MSDLQDKLNQILQNPEAMKQVQSLGAQLGLTGEQKQPPKPKPPENNLMSVLGGDDTIGTIAKFAPLLSSLNNSDDTTRLLDSLRPFLSHERQEIFDTLAACIDMTCRTARAARSDSYRPSR